MNAERFKKAYGPWAVVTGASDGIGRAFAERIAGLGLNLVLVARRADALRDLANRLAEACRVEVRAVAVDLGKPEGLERLDRETSGLDVGLYIACAGFGTSGPILEADLIAEHDMLQVNCFALLHGCVVFGRRLRRRGGGGIILMSSLVGWQGTPMAAHYAATKAYVQSLAESLRLELKPWKIDVLASAPGPVDSGFAARADMAMSVAAAPSRVAKATLNALGRTATVIPGGLSKVLTWSLLPLPRSLRARIMGRIMRGMTKHQEARRSG